MEAILAIGMESGPGFLLSGMNRKSSFGDVDVESPVLLGCVNEVYLRYYLNDNRLFGEQ